MKHLFVLISILTTLSAQAKNKTALIFTDTTEITENNVHYKVYSDNNYIFLSIKTTDRRLSRAIIKNGLTIYFDIKGKQKKDVYIKYPYGTVPRQLRQNPQERNQNEKSSSIDLNAIIENIPKEAEYGYYDEKQPFNKDLNSQDISLGYKITKDVLEFSLKIPKDKINNENKTDFSKLSIGVLTNKLERNSEKRKHQGQNQGMRRGNGNRYKGGMGRESNKMSHRAEGSTPNPQTAERINIDFWFDTKLEKK